ncbi:MAG: hypothetical protein K2K93_01390 [Muribaculaceae bacterium]|nr:hypothetical protein [Muribaculaceae bacterium]
MKQILKSIISRPGRSVGLLIEIIIVTIIGWIVIEPVAILTTTALLPAGYDHERLVQVDFSRLSRRSEDFDGEIPDDKEQQMEAYDRLLRKIRERDGVEHATFFYSQSFESLSYGQTSINPDSIYCLKDDDNYVGVTMIDYQPGTDFFATYGIKDPQGKPFNEPKEIGAGYIVSKTVAKALVHDGSVIGTRFYNWGDDEDDDERPSTIVGVTADAPYRKGDGRQPVAFKIADPEWAIPQGITIRLGQGVNPRAFTDRLISGIGEYRSGNWYITHPQLLSDMRETCFAGMKRELTQKWIIMIFFLVNVLLGIAGTFYVQCKTRIPDAGVMRAFGASRRRIEWHIIAEACVTVLAGWLIGSVIYLIYLHFQGFPMDSDIDYRIVKTIRPIWHDTKLGRYSMIGGIILLLLLATAALGAWLPARKVGRVPIVDSLRDE